MKERERFEQPMYRYFPYFSLEVGSEGSYTNTHVSVAYAMYQWGITDAKLRVPGSTVTGIGGWEVEIPPDMLKVLGDNLSDLYEE